MAPKAPDTGSARAAHAPSHPAAPRCQGFIQKFPSPPQRQQRGRRRLRQHAGRVQAAPADTGSTAAAVPAPPGLMSPSVNAPAPPGVMSPGVTWPCRATPSHPKSFPRAAAAQPRCYPSSLPDTRCHQISSRPSWHNLKQLPRRGQVPAEPPLGMQQPAFGSRSHVLGLGSGVGAKRSSPNQSRCSGDGLPGPAAGAVHAPVALEQGSPRRGG